MNRTCVTSASCVLDSPFKKLRNWCQGLVDDSSKAFLIQSIGTLHINRSFILSIQLSRQVMTYLRMPLSIETGKEAEFNTSTDIEHKRRLIFPLECAVIMRERPCFPMAGVQSLDNLRMIKKWGIKIKDNGMIWERFALQLNPVGNFLLVLQMTLRSTHIKIYLLINDPSIHLSIQYLFPNHSLAKKKNL